jgi:tagaturonate reductase
MEEREAINKALRTVTRPERVLQFGEGNFLRAFVDWQIDLLNEKAGFNGSIVIVPPREQGAATGRLLNEQQGLYTTVLRGLRDGRPVEEFRAISSVSRCISAHTDYDAFLKIAENPGLRFVFSNTTEAGIAYDAGDRLDSRPPRSFPGKLAALLQRRFEHFTGDPAKALLIIPCELIEKNGDTLKAIIRRYAAEWKLGAGFSAWLDGCGFCNTLVDRIVPGYPRADAEAIQQKIAYTDKLLVSAELFSLFVIETKTGCRDYRAELPFEKAGLNVIWTENLDFYRTRKVRILNGAHTMSVLAAFLCGLDTVDQCVTDPLISKLMKKGIFEEIIPSIDNAGNGAAGDAAAGAALTEYANDVLERFANPYIRHQLLSISLNSVSKFKTRVLPSLLGYLQKTGAVPPVLSFSLAALIAFYNGKNNRTADTKVPASGFTGMRSGVPYPINDDDAVLSRFAAFYADADASADADAARKITRAVLAESAWWGEDLTKYPGLEEAAGSRLETIRTRGIRAAIENTIEGPSE